MRKPNWLLYNKHPEFRKLAVLLKPILGFRAKDILIYAQAFRHKSATSEEKYKGGNNERLEYLGDAILDAIVSKYLYEHFPAKNEGFLTNMRAKLVSRKQLNDLSIKLGVPALIESNLQHSGQSKSINGNALEALIGAIYLDRGYRVTEKWVIQRMLSQHLDMDDVQNFVISYKSKLIEWSQKQKANVRFEIVQETGEQHNKRYHIKLLVDNKDQANGYGQTIKEAEEAASQIFYGKIMSSQG